MRRGIIFTFIFLLLAAQFISAEIISPDSSSGTAAEEDVNKIQNITEKLPVNDSGIDITKIRGYKSEAEKKIDAINQWIFLKAPWLKLAFGMVPEISWLFAMNILIWLFAFTYLFMNLNIPKKIMFTSSDTLARFFGGVVFILLIIILKVNYLIASAVNTILETWWIKLIIVVAIVILFFVASAISKSLAASAIKEEEAEASQNRKELGALVEGIKEGSK